MCEKQDVPDMTFDEHVQTFMEDLTDPLECRDLAKAAIAADIREQKLVAARHIWAAWLARMGGDAMIQGAELDRASNCADRIHRRVLELRAMDSRNGSKRDRVQA
jgi:hypothetical protein